MKSFVWWAGCCMVASLVGGPTAAQPATSSAAGPASLASSPGPSAGDLALRLAWEAAWQRAVLAREAQGQRRRAEAERAAAASLLVAPPSLELSHRSDRLLSSAGRHETEVGVAVPLWLPGQRAARGGVAEASVGLAAAAEQAARLRLAGEVREAAWLLISLVAELRQVDREVELLQQLAGDVDRRVQAGDLARADALAAQAEFLAAQAAQAAARQRLSAARAQWAQLTGLNEAPPLDDVITAVEPVDVAPSHPELQLAREATALARKRLELQRQTRRDAPELSVGVRQDNPGRGAAAQGSMLLGLRWPLGTEARNGPLEAAALSERDLAEVQEQRLRERLDSEATAAREAQRLAVLQRDAEAARARLLRERASLIDKSFRAGESPLPDLLRALAAAAQADSALARQTAALGMARARLQQALGYLP